MSHDFENIQTQPGTDFSEEHNKDNLDRPNAVIDHLNVQVKEEPNIAQATCFITDQPDPGDTVTLTDLVTIVDVYEFDGVGGNINVPIGATEDETRDNLADAINNQGRMPVVAEHTLTFSEGVHVEGADRRGGTPTSGVGFFAPASFSSANNWWTSGAAVLGTPARSGQMTRGRITVDATMIASPTGWLHVRLPFEPDYIDHWVYAATSNAAKPNTMTVTKVGGLVLFNYLAGAQPLEEGDVIAFVAWKES